MEFSFNNSEPIYKQLVDNLKIAIVRGDYKLGEKIPSVREYALMLKVNPNTINRALLVLEEENLLVTKRTNGKYVTEDKKVIENAKKDLAKEIIEKFKIDIKNLNINLNDAIKLIKGE